MKRRTNINIDLDVWHQTQAAALRLQMSASRLTEEVLREFLALEKLEKERKRHGPKLAKAADLSA
jgi:hypothetical protein